MQRFFTIFAGAVLAVAAQSAMAGGNPAAGQQKSQTCAACHGKTGNSQNAMYPKLAGQYQSYLYHALKAYKSGDRQNPIMSGMVANLSDQDMQDLAAYFSSQEAAIQVLPLEKADN